MRVIGLWAREICCPPQYAGVSGDWSRSIRFPLKLAIFLRQETSAELIESVFAEHLPFPDQYFDHAVCLGALLYFKDPRQALLEMRRVLKPGGRVVLRTVNKENLYTLWTRRKLDPASKICIPLKNYTN